MDRRNKERPPVRYPPDGLLTHEASKHDVDLDPRIIASDSFISDDWLDDFEPVNLCLLTTTEELKMNTSEDEPSTGLNGRLRPRKLHVPSPQNKAKIKSEGKASLDKPKRTSTPSKTLPNKQDDLANKSDSSSTPHFFCTFCDRKFASKQTVSKHIRRIHYPTSKQDALFNCLFCNHTEADSNIIRHMVDSHPNQYFACLDCLTRFSSTSELAEHKLNVCEKQKVTYRTKLRQKIARGSKKSKKTLDDSRKGNYSKNDKDFQDGHGFNGIVISCEPPQGHDGADIEDNITTNLILPPSKNLRNNAVLEKNAVIVLDDINWKKNIPNNFAFHNSDPDQILSRLGVVHRSPRTGDSTKKDWFKALDESTQKFERCFDTKFYSKVASNVQENLAKFLDGSFNFNPDPDSTIKTRKSKNNVVINTAEGFPILLANEQYSRSVFDSYMPRAIAPKHKWKWDNLENDRSLMTAAEILKRDSHTNNCIISLVSSLDIWTQLSMRRKFEDKFHIQPIEKKTEKQNIISRELKEILESREIPTSTQIVKACASKPAQRACDVEFPLSLGLVTATPTYEVQPAVLSGEWVRPRCYVCCACGQQTTDPKGLSTHISTQHPNAQVQHYEIVGDQLLNADILKHLYVPPSQVCNRTRPPRGFRECTKCNKSVTLDDLHQHMLDCAGDTPAVRRRQPRQRPFGVRRRRSRMPDSTIRKKIRKNIRSRQRRQKPHIGARPRIRTEVGDAETIRKMLADLPAKRHRVLVNPVNMIQRPRRKLDLQRSKLITKKCSREELKNRRQSARKVTPVENNESNRNTSTIDDDEDNKPLKPKLKLTASRRESLKRQAVISMSKRKTVRAGKTRISESANKISDAPITSDIQEASLDRSPERINIKNASYNTRENANRGASNNRDNQRPGCSGTNGSANNNCAPPQNVPLKHSIARLTANSETHDKSVQFHHSFLVQQECNNTDQHVPTGQRILFENEAVVSKLDKPPLNLFQKGFYDLNKNKANKPRKGLNDCIAMLKNKLVDPIPGQGTDHVSVQCGSDEPIDDEPRISDRVTIEKDSTILCVDFHPQILQPEEILHHPYRHDTIKKSSQVSDNSQQQDNSTVAQHTPENPKTLKLTPDSAHSQEKNMFARNPKQDPTLKLIKSSSNVPLRENFNVVPQESSLALKQTSECVQATKNFNVAPHYKQESTKNIAHLAENTQVQGSFNFLPQYCPENVENINQSLEVSQVHVNINTLPQYQQETTTSKQNEHILKRSSSHEKTSCDNQFSVRDKSAKTLSRGGSSHIQTAETVREHSKRRSVDVYYESDANFSKKYENWQKSVDLTGKSILPKSLEVLPGKSLLSKAVDILPAKGGAQEVLPATSSVKSKSLDLFPLTSIALPKSLEVLPKKHVALDKPFEMPSAQSGLLSKSPQVTPKKGCVLQQSVDILPVMSSGMTIGVLPTNTKHSKSYTHNAPLLNESEIQLDNEIAAPLGAEARMMEIPTNIPPAHASTKAESIISAPLDLSSKMSYATHLPCVENYETLDLSNKKTDKPALVIPPEEDIIVDLRVKPSHLRDSPTTLDLCVKLANSNIDNTFDTHIGYTYPTDLSVRGKDSSSSDKSCRTSGGVPVIQDMSGLKSIPVSNTLSMVGPSKENIYAKDLSDRTIKSVKSQFNQETHKVSRDSTDSVIGKRCSSNSPDDFNQKECPEQQKPLKTSSNLDQTLTSEQKIVPEIEPIEPEIADKLPLQMLKHVYDPTLIIPQYKIRTNAPATENTPSGHKGESTCISSTSVASVVSQDHIKNSSGSSQAFKRTTISPLTAVSKSTPITAETSSVCRTESATPVYTSANIGKTVTKTESSTATVLTETHFSSPTPTTINYDTDTVHGSDKNQSIPPISLRKGGSNDADSKGKGNANQSIKIDSVVDHDPETAKKIALLPKELVEILGNMPIDHRNQLLNVLPQYVSTTINSSITTDTYKTSVDATTPVSKWLDSPARPNKLTNEINASISSHHCAPLSGSQLDKVHKPAQTLGNSVTDRKHSLSNLTPMEPVHDVVTDKCQSANENIHSLPQKSQQYSDKEKGKTETGKYSVDPTKISLAVDSVQKFSELQDKIIDLTEDENVSSVARVVDVIRSTPIPPQIPVSGGTVIKSKLKSNSDKTASLRAVRIKAPSERQKNNEMLNRASVEQMSAQKVNDSDITELNKSTELIKSLAIQQAEISSTQHSNKTITIVSKSAAIMSPVDATKSSKKHEALLTHANDADNVKQKQLDITSASAAKPSIVTSSIPVTSIEKLVTEEEKFKASKSIDVALNPAINADFIKKHTVLDINQLVENTEESQIEKLSVPQVEEDSEDDMILASIVKKNQNVQNFTSRSKRIIKKKKMNKKSKTTLSTESVIKNKINANTQFLEENLTKTMDVTSHSDSKKLKRRSKKISQEQIETGLVTAATTYSNEDLKLKDSDNTVQADLKNSEASLENVKEICNKTEKITDIQIQPISDEIPNTKEIKSIDQEVHSELNCYNVAAQEKNQEQSRVVSLQSETVNENLVPEEDKSSKNDELQDDLQFRKKELKGTNNKEFLEIDCSKQVCDEPTPTKDVDINITLRRSRRGKSLYVDGYLSAHGGLADIVIDQKAPLTKKQLIFSKLLLDEENNTRSIISSTGNDITSVVENTDAIKAVSSANECTETNTTTDHPIPKENSTNAEKFKSMKRKKSPQSKRKIKKNKTIDSVQVSEKNNVDQQSSDKTNLVTLISAVEGVESCTENIKSSKSAEKLSESTSSAELCKTEDNSTIISDYNNENQIELDKIKTENTVVKRKLSKSTAEIECDASSKLKKAKLDNDKETAEHAESEPIEKSAPVVTTCYDVPVPSRRTRSKSVVIKSSSVELYDPYNIDLEDMIQKPEPLRKVAKCKQIKRKRKSSSKLTDLQRADLETKSINAITDLVKKDDDIQESELAPSSKNKSTTDLCVLELKPSEREIMSKKARENLDRYVKGTASDSDESSKSDVPLKKYVEDKAKKLSESPAALSVAEGNNKHDAEKSSYSLNKKAYVPSTRKNSGSANLSNEIEEQMRSEQFMESFGFFSERKPRKSNLLASKKISETFHIIANESDDLYYGSKERPSKRSIHPDTKKSSEAYITEQSASKKSTKRGRKKKGKDQEKEEPYYCNVCKKEFRRSDNILRHRMTLLHIAKVAEVEMKVKIAAVPEEPNYLIAFKQHMDRLKILTDKAAKQKKSSKTKIVLPTLDEVVADVFKTVREQQLARRGLSRDEALFLDCCELLKESHRPEVSAQVSASLNNYEHTQTSSTADLDFIKKSNDRRDSKSDGDVDSLTAKTILESEEVRNLENYLISGFKEAASVKNASMKVEYHATPCTMTIQPHEISSELFLRPDCDLHCEQIKVHKRDIVAPAESDLKTKKHPEYKEKMYPDIIEDIDMFEDKFDKIKRKCRSQAAAAKQVQNVAEPSSRHKGRKKTDKKKGKKISKKNYQNTVLTKGALKGFDGIKVSIPTSDINMSAIVPPSHEASPKKKRKTNSKKKRETRDSETSSKYDSDHRSKDNNNSQKKVDVYEFMDNEDAELFEFRPSTLMERFKSFNKEAPSTSKRDALPEEPDNSSESASDGDDFVYMSDDYVCSDDETENSLLSELGTVKSDPKKATPLKRKDIVEKNAVMGKIFKLNAVRSEKKIVKSKETPKPKANLDQLFDSLLEEEPNSSMLNESESPKREEKSSPRLSSEQNHHSRQSSLSPDKSSLSSKVIEAEYGLPVRKNDVSKQFKYRHSTSKHKDLDIYSPSTSGTSDIIAGECSAMLTKTTNLSSTKKRDKSPKHLKSPILVDETSELKKSRDKSPSDNLRETEYSNEFDEDTGVARHRARRKCTVGKQNVLAETWSSESEPDGLPQRPTSAESVVASVGRKKKSRKRDGQLAVGRRGKIGLHKKQDIESRVNNIRSTSSSGAVSHSSSSGARFASEAAENERNGGDSSVSGSQHEDCPPASPPPPPPPATASTSSGVTTSKVRPRPASYYWSTEGDDEQETQQQQHGWIVGNSHKRLVTMLAHAKGRKRDNDDNLVE